jgi:hypothetical protein
MKLAKFLSVVVFLNFLMMPTAQATVCLTNPCANGGTCSKNDGTFQCRCTAEWFGSTCTIPWTPIPPAPSPDPIVPLPDPVAAPTSVTAPSTIALSVIALIGLIGLRWSRRKRKL